MKIILLTTSLIALVLSPGLWHYRSHSPPTTPQTNQRPRPARLLRPRHRATPRPATVTAASAGKRRHHPHRLATARRSTSVEKDTPTAVNCPDTCAEDWMPYTTNGQHPPGRAPPPHAHHQHPRRRLNTTDLQPPPALLRQRHKKPPAAMRDKPNTIGGLCTPSARTAPRIP